MQRARSLLLLAGTLFFVAACSSSDSTTDPGPTPITIDDIVGSWTATSHTYTDNANPNQSFDLIANGGETRSTVLAGGATRTWVEIGALSDEWDGLVTISGSTLTNTPAESTRPTRVWAFVLSGNVLTLTDTNSAFDFAAPGGENEVPATEVVVFLLQ